MHRHLPMFALIAMLIFCGKGMAQEASVTANRPIVRDLDLRNIRIGMTEREALRVLKSLNNNGDIPPYRGSRGTQLIPHDYDFIRLFPNNGDDAFFSYIAKDKGSGTYYEVLFMPDPRPAGDGFEVVPRVWAIRISGQQTAEQNLPALIEKFGPPTSVSEGDSRWCYNPHSIRGCPWQNELQTEEGRNFDSILTLESDGPVEMRDYAIVSRFINWATIEMQRRKPQPGF